MTTTEIKQALLNPTEENETIRAPAELMIGFSKTMKATARILDEMEQDRDRWRETANLHADNEKKLADQRNEVTAKNANIVSCTRHLIEVLDHQRFGPGPAIDDLRKALAELDGKNDSN